MMSKIATMMYSTLITSAEVHGMRKRESVHSSLLHSRDDAQSFRLAGPTSFTPGHGRDPAVSVHALPRPRAAQAPLSVRLLPPRTDLFGLHAPDGTGTRSSHRPPARRAARPLLPPLGTGERGEDVESKPQ